MGRRRCCCTTEEPPPGVVVEARGCFNTPLAGALVETRTPLGVLVSSGYTGPDGRIEIVDPGSEWLFSYPPYFEDRTAAPGAPVGGVRPATLNEAYPYSCCMAYPPRARAGVVSGWTVFDSEGEVPISEGDGCSGGGAVARTMDNGATDRFCGPVENELYRVTPYRHPITTDVLYSWIMRRENEGGPIATQTFYMYDRTFYQILDSDAPCEEVTLPPGVHWLAFPIGYTYSGGLWYPNGSGSYWPGYEFQVTSTGYSIASTDPLTVTFEFDMSGDWFRDDGSRPTGRAFSPTLVVSEGS